MRGAFRRLLQDNPDVSVVAEASSASDAAAALSRQAVDVIVMCATTGGGAIRTSEIADAIRSFREAGFTRLEIMMNPGTMGALEALALVVEQVHAD